MEINLVSLLKNTRKITLIVWKLEQPTEALIDLIF